MGSSDPPTPVSVLLPTVEWTMACEEVADQLDEDDELLIVCDTDDDPVADVAAGTDAVANENVRLVVAGEPEACSGKANAIAAGMEAASHDRLLWTDDDFHHPPDWLDQLRSAYERHGPVTELPFFVGQDPLATLLEPTYAIGGTLGVYVSDLAWGGAVIFDRDDLDVSQAQFLADLRRTVSDDGLLAEHVDVTALRRTRRVPVGGSTRETLERHARFTQIVRHHEPMASVGMGVSAIVSAGLAIAFPVPMLVLATIAMTALYLAFGVRRWTALLAYPALLAQVPLLVYGIGRRTFVWGGRRYRWRGKFDVEIVER